jgi:hypothetical protein
MRLIVYALIGLSLGTFAYAEEALMEMPERDPSSMQNLAPSSKRTYPGGADEEDLQVLNRLPDSQVKTDSRSVQREVYKALYNEEMKEERQENVEE